MKRLLIILLVLFFASPVSAFPGRDNDDATDWPTDCEKYPYLHVCQQPDDPRTKAERCLDRYVTQYEQAEMRTLDSASQSHYWYNVNLMHLYEALALEMHAHIEAGGKVGDAIECDLEEIEVEEEEVEEVEEEEEE